MKAAFALLMLPMLASCVDGNDDNPCEEAPAAEQFLNITISVSAEDLPATRAAGDNPTPQGGEDGDGREAAAFDSENAIKDITFILADGPLDSDGATIAFIRNYPVSLSTDDYPTDGHGHTNSDIEKKYTTGNQRVSREELDMTENKQYYVYVVANKAVTASKGDPLSNIKDMTSAGSQIFSGNGYDPLNCNDFVMTSEQDVTINFAVEDDIDKTELPNAVTYQLKRPIVIERLAARLDFCTAYSNASKTAAYGEYDVTVDGVAQKVKGFKYDTTASTISFILESITPFNIFDEQEYFFERVTTGWAEGATTTYLGRETTANFIVDPHTADKVSAPTLLSYVSRLEATMPAANPWQRTAEALRTSNTTADNFVVAYCMENTLMPASPLKTYATGLVITGSYYDADNKFLFRKSFYGYLRHHSEVAGSSAATYNTTELTAENLTADTRTGTAGIAMNFGIVRNNIYRVNIESVDAAMGWLKFRIAVHDWREVTHPEIYL